jgi:hypothetical protein
MHSSHFEDPTGKCDRIVVHHNGGYVGDIILTKVKDHEVKEEFRVNFSILKNLVFAYLRQEIESVDEDRFRQIERMDDEELEKVLLHPLPPVRKRA